MSNYNNACTEVYTILNYLSKDEYKKIPQNVIEVIKANRDSQYTYDFNEKLELKQQKMLKETKAILYNLFRDFLCTEKQREIIKKQQEEERKKNEIKRIGKYNPDVFKDIKKKQNIEDIQSNNTVDNSLAMVYYKESFSTKIITRIKQFIKHKRK